MKHVIVAHGNEHQKLLLRCVEAESEEGQKDRPEQQGKLSIVPKVILYILVGEETLKLGEVASHFCGETGLFQYDVEQHLGDAAADKGQQIKRVQVLHAGLAPLPILLLERPLLEE